MRNQGADALGFTCLPMGWAWAPYIAQKVLEFVLERAGESAFLLHKHPVPLVGNSEGGPSVAMPYLDDFLLIARGGTEKDALEQASERLTRQADSTDLLDSLTRAADSTGLHKLTRQAASTG